MGSGYTPGVPRLGVINPGFREGDTATALPASIALGSSFNSDLVRTGGRMIALEARSRGFNVRLAGGINLARDPRNGLRVSFGGSVRVTCSLLSRSTGYRART